MFLVLRLDLDTDPQLFFFIYCPVDDMLFKVGPCLCCFWCVRSLLLLWHHAAGSKPV